MFFWGGVGFLGLLAACGNPKRDFETANERAGTGGLADSGAGGRAVGGAAGFVASNRAGAAGSNPPSGGDASAGADAGAGGEAGRTSEPSIDCASGLQRSCADAHLLGSCALGTETCGSDGKWGPCSIAPKADSCVLGNDDSCDGAPNEGCGCVDGKDSACVAAKGNCAEGTQKCSGGSLAACTVAAKAQDSCAPGDDANCNGIPNEGCTCKNGEMQPCGPAKAVGKCKPGLSTCSAGAFGTCVGAVGKANRDCRSPDDNDCDGAPDNTIDTVCVCLPAKQQSCAVHAGLDGKGICKAGTMTCLASSDNTASYWGSCVGAVGPTSRNCASSSDNDCNGVADNQESACACSPGAKQPCQTHAQDGKGICKAGSQTCSLSSDGTSSAWGMCTGSVGPAARDCTSHLDNNCDGALDDAIDGVCQCTTASCGADTTCKLSSGSSQCVACLSDSNCSNGATCASNACQCKAGFNGNRCQYQKFRAIGTVLGDSGGSFATNISPDGSTVVGYSQSSDIATRHPWRFVSVLNAIPRPAGQSWCEARAVDSKLAIYGRCNNSSFQYVNGTTSPFSFSSYTAYASDVSKDGQVVVGYADFDGQQAIRRSGSATTLIPKLGTDFSAAYATNSDGSVVGDEYVFFHVGWYWTQKLGTVQLAQLPDFGNYDPADVSGDGKVIVGYDWESRGIKWSGSEFLSIETKPGHYNSTSYDGKVIVGYTGDSASRGATVWDASGPHPVSGYVEVAALSGWTLSEAVAVSDDGKWVVGNGTHNGANEPWVVHLP